MHHELEAACEFVNSCNNLHMYDINRLNLTPNSQKICDKIFDAIYVISVGELEYEMMSIALSNCITFFTLIIISVMFFGFVAHKFY